VTDPTVDRAGNAVISGCIVGNALLPCCVVRIGARVDGAEAAGVGRRLDSKSKVDDVVLGDWAAVSDTAGIGDDASAVCVCSGEVVDACSAELVEDTSGVGTRLGKLVAEDVESTAEGAALDSNTTGFVESGVSELCIVSGCMVVNTVVPRCVVVRMGASVVACELDSEDSDEEICGDSVDELAVPSELLVLWATV